MPLQAPDKAKPLPKHIYELSKHQFDCLNVAANGGNVCFAVIEPAENDPPEKKKKLAEEVREIKDLISLGLVEDVSHRFKETIEVAKVNSNRGITVVALTPVGIVCFRNSHDRTIH